MAKTLSSEQTLDLRLGSDTKFPIKGNFESIKGVDLVIQDIQQLLLTHPGERLNRPSYGSGLRGLLWENIDTAARTGPGLIASALANFEPRIKVTAVDVAELNSNTGLLTFVIRFSILSTDTKVNLIFPFRTGTDLSFA